MLGFGKAGVTGEWRRRGGQQGHHGHDDERFHATPHLRQPFVIASMAAISSALKAQSIVFTFCSTCSTRVAPAITLDTCGRDASQEKASSSMLWPRACAKACSFSTMSWLRG